MIVLDAAAATGIALQMLKVGDLLLRPDQKRRFQQHAESLTLWLSYLEPIRLLRFLNTARGRTLLVLASAGELSIKSWAHGDHVGPLVVILIAFAALFLGLRIRFFGTLLERYFNYLFEPFNPCFSGQRGAVSKAIAEFYRRTMGSTCALGLPGAAFAVFLIGVMATVLVIVSAAFEQGAGTGIAVLPFGLLIFVIGLLLLPIFNTTTIFCAVLALTFCAELLVILMRAVTWRVVEYTGGAFGAVLAISTAIVTLLAILFRIK
jgi:hypothetical protein